MNKTQTKRALGAHCSIAGGLWKAVERADKLGGTALQIFTRNQVQWKIPHLSEEDVSKFREAVNDYQIKFVCAHASYLVNLATPDDELRRRSINALVKDMQRGERLGCECLVFHPGSHKGKGTEYGCTRVAEAVEEILTATDDSTIKLAIENTAGQGNTLGGTLQDLATIREYAGNPQRLGMCLDTAHAFAAGLNFSDKPELNAMLKKIDNAFGLNNLLVLHLNDSKTECGSNHDRHDHIGHGFIGDAGFKNILNHPDISGVPGILETPKEMAGTENADAENLTRILLACKPG